MVAAPVRTPLVTNIHHTYQHQCLPNEDTLSQQVLSLTHQTHRGIAVYICKCTHINVNVCMVHVLVHVCLQPTLHTGKVASRSPESCIICKPTIKKWQWQPYAYKSEPIIHLSLSVSMLYMIGDLAKGSHTQGPDKCFGWFPLWVMEH